MSKSSLDYWREREQEANKNAIRDEEAYNKRIEEIYSYTERNIQRTINDFYARYASKEGITMNEAKKRVREIDMRHYEQLARKYVREHDFSAQANEEMALYNLTMKVNRLELLKAEINLELIDGYNDIEKEMRKDLLEQAMKVDARYAGILGKSAIGNQKYAHQLVNASFMGATFSERLWGVNMPDLRAHLEVELRNGLIQGIHPTELARRFRKHYGGSVQDTERLMVTEMRRLQTAVQAESFERNDFKEYQFITAGDERVCPECAKLHGQHFKVSEMQVGENAPPMHPRCHCSTTAYMDSDKYKQWIDALANGEDVRWDEFEAEDSDEDIYTIRRILDKRTEDKTRMSPRALKIFNTKPIVEQMKEINKLLDSYCSNPSLWSGKIIIDDSMSRWGKHDRKTHDITLRTDSPIKTKFHELIHTRTVFLNGVVEKETSIKFRPLNEAITEVVARGICKAEGIQVMNLSYPILVRNFRNIAFIMGIDELKLGLTLIDMPYKNRYDWIKTMLEAMKNNNEISKEDYLEAKFCLEGLIKEI